MTREYEEDYRDLLDIAKHPENGDCVGIIGFIDLSGRFYDGLFYENGRWINFSNIDCTDVCKIWFNKVINPSIQHPPSTAYEVEVTKIHPSQIRFDSTRAKQRLKNLLKTNP